MTLAELMRGDMAEILGYLMGECALPRKAAGPWPHARGVGQGGGRGTAGRSL